METEFKEVTKDEYEDFLMKYPKKLHRNVAAMFDPPLVSFNDFSTGRQWPESIVAKSVFDQDPEKRTYAILNQPWK